MSQYCIIEIDYDRLLGSKWGIWQWHIWIILWAVFKSTCQWNIHQIQETFFTMPTNELLLLYPRKCHPILLPGTLLLLGRQRDKWSKIMWWLSFNWPITMSILIPHWPVSNRALGPHLAGGSRNWDVIVTPGVWGWPPAPEPDTQRTGFIIPAHK